MDASLRARFARLGPIQGIARVAFGSPATFILRLAPGRGTPRTIDATHALARRGLTLLRAKRAIERLVAEGRVVVALPTVEDAATLTDDLAAAGIIAARRDPSATVDVRALRERLRLTREQFAASYGLEVETMRNWETGKREPDTTARSYLRAIANDPEGVGAAYATTPGQDA